MQFHEISLNIFSASVSKEDTKKRNPNWARIRKRKPFFHLAKTRHLAFRDCKKIGWQQLLVDCANSIVTHKDFQEQHSSLLPPGGSYFEENYLQKLKSIQDQSKSFDTDRMDFFLRSVVWTFMILFKTSMPTLQIIKWGWEIEFFAIHFPWKEAS